MATSVVMPALEMAQETGKIVSWIKKEGDTVRKGEPLLEVETDKAVVEIEASADGVLRGVKAQAGDVIPVGATIAWLLAPAKPFLRIQEPLAKREDDDRTGSPKATAAPSPLLRGRRQRQPPGTSRFLQKHGGSRKSSAWTSPPYAVPDRMEPLPATTSRQPLTRVLRLRLQRALQPAPVSAPSLD
jgi:pyruvate/2-oxoglutarate dehydrogenase complex dihydrolipoamide acyltransferase (E2) component